MYLTYTSRMMECRRDGYEEGLFTGLATGREEGAYQNKLETARKLIARGSQPEDIADVTGLSLLQIKELMAE